MDVKNIVNNFRDRMTNSAFAAQIYLSIAALIVIVIIIFYITNTQTLNKNNINRIVSNFKSFQKTKDIGTVISLNSGYDENNDILKNYYIMGSYNSCCGGSNYNDWVHIDVLKEIIKRGVRVLDFELYSKDGMPIIAAGEKRGSYVEKITKGTYNHLTTKQVLSTVKDGFYSLAPNSNDPIIINFRMKTQNKNAYNKLYKEIQDIFSSSGGHLLSSSYGYAGKENQNDVTKTKLSQLHKKLIISIYDPTSTYKETKLHELVNIVEGINLVNKNNVEVQHRDGNSNIVDDSKDKLHFVLPDDIMDNNPPMISHQKEGCQVSLMKFSKYDSNLKYCLAYFYNKQQAFVRKPEKLRRIPINTKKPKPVDKRIIEIKTKEFKFDDSWKK